MYTNRLLYYLQQLGIRPWVSRLSQAVPCIKLLVLVDTERSDPANALLKQLLAYLPLEQKGIQYIDAASREMPVFPSHAQLLVLNLSQTKTMDSPVLEKLQARQVPVYKLIQGLSLTDLLRHPLKKRRLLADLSSLRQCIEHLKTSP